MPINRLLGPSSPGLKIALVLASLLPPALSAPARADDFDETRSVTVSTHGLDLNAPADAALLRQRIERAARQVCGLFDAGTLSTQTSYRSCHAEAIADANAQLQVMVARSHDHTLFVSDVAGH